LAEQGSKQPALTARDAEPAGERGEREALERQQREHDAGDQQWAAREQAEVDRHTDCDEEQPEQEALERLEVGLERVAVLRAGEQHTRQERAERHRHVSQRHQLRDPGDDQQRERGEHLARVGLGDHAQQRPRQEAADHDHGRDRCQYAQRARGIVVGAVQPGIRQQRHQTDQRDRGDVLEQQDGEAASADRCGHQVALVHALHGDRRRREREREAGHERGAPGQSHDHEESTEQRAAQRHLHAAAEEHVAPHRPEALGVELEPDREQHQHHAELGEVHDRLDILDEAEPERPDRAAGDQIAEHRAEPEPLGDRYEHDRREQIDDGVEQDPTFMHGQPPARSAARGSAPRPFARARR
jgi:hypothetical protein